MKEEADEPAVSETVEPPKMDEATVGEHPDVVVAPQPTPPFQPAPQAPQNMAAEPLVRRQCLFLRHLFHKLLFLLLEDRWILQTRRRFVLPLGF